MKNKYILEIVAFITGGIGMIVELVASRILSPYLGNSNLIWTCIIGMMLAFMSLGYYIGGKISDKHPKLNLLSLFLLDAGIFICLIPLIEIYVIKPLSNTSLSLPLIAIITSTITFGIPSMLLAMASPFAVKLEGDELGNIGKTSGRISACSTVGSIVGTFLAGFLLIPKLGVKNVILMIVIILCILSFLLREDKDIKYIIKAIIMLVLLVFLYFIGKQLFFKKNSDILLDTDSQYSRIWVKKIHDSGGNEFNTLQVDLGLESIDSKDNELSSTYLKYYDLFEIYKPDTNNVLMIGGAAYTYPTYYLNKYPDKKIDVVEIDPKMTEIAKQFFNLDTNNSNLKIYHEDGRRYLNTNTKKYDCILIDAFKGLNAPFQLTTYEAMQQVKRSLSDDGIVITNIVGSLTGTNSKMIKYEYATYKAVFDDVKIFQIQKDYFNDDEIQNIILIGSNKKLEPDENNTEKYKNYLDKELTQFQCVEKIATDDLCPIGI